MWKFDSFRKKRGEHDFGRLSLAITSDGEQQTVLVHVGKGHDIGASPTAGEKGLHYDCRVQILKFEDDIAAYEVRRSDPLLVGNDRDNLPRRFWEQALPCTRLVCPC
jgi:hypothetical protein